MRLKERTDAKTRCALCHEPASERCRRCGLVVHQSCRKEFGVACDCVPASSPPQPRDTTRNRPCSPEVMAQIQHYLATYEQTLPMGHMNYDEAHNLLWREMMTIRRAFEAADHRYALKKGQAKHSVMWMISCLVGAVMLILTGFAYNSANLIMIGVSVIGLLPIALSAATPDEMWRYLSGTRFPEEEELLRRYRHASGLHSYVGEEQTWGDGTTDITSEAEYDYLPRFLPQEALPRLRQSAWPETEVCDG